MIVLPTSRASKPCNTMLGTSTPVLRKRRTTSRMKLKEIAISSQQTQAAKARRDMNFDSAAGCTSSHHHQALSAGRNDSRQFARVGPLAIELIRVASFLSS